METTSEASKSKVNIFQAMVPGVSRLTWLNIFCRLLGSKLYIGTSLYDTLK
jgi:hypothetical protein